jgi:hypothetical protein
MQGGRVHNPPNVMPALENTNFNFQPVQPVVGVITAQPVVGVITAPLRPLRPLRKGYICSI